MKKLLGIVVLGLLWCNHLQAACAVVNGKTYGDCSNVKIKKIQKNYTPKELKGSLSGMINGDAIVNKSATLDGMVNGNILIKPGAHLKVYGSVGGSIENYGNLYVSGVVGGSIINFDNSSTTVEGIVKGDLFGKNFKKKPGSIISGVPTP
tara:strand:+ start:114 stop:563 length:450 start_codon:yes stop_codon:yes gene_type:complete